MAAPPYPARSRSTCRVRRPAAAHRHTVLTVTTHTRLGRHKGQRGYFGSRGGAHYTPPPPPPPEPPPPNRHTTTPPPRPARPASTTAAPKPSPATPPRAYR